MLLREGAVGSAGGVLVNPLEQKISVKDRVGAILDQASAQLTALHIEIQDDFILAVTLGVCISPMNSHMDEDRMWVYSSNMPKDESLLEALQDLAETIADPEDQETVKHLLV